MDNAVLQLLIVSPDIDEKGASPVSRQNKKEIR
jgi:hypothetical protein